MIALTEGLFLLFVFYMNQMVYGQGTCNKFSENHSLFITKVYANVNVSKYIQFISLNYLKTTLYRFIIKISDINQQ